MDRISKFIMIAVVACGVIMLSSCSSSPSDEELKQLTDLKAQIASLEGQISTMQRDKTGLEKQIGEKNAKLAQCQSDQDAVKKGLGK